MPADVLRYWGGEGGAYPKLASVVLGTRVWGAAIEKRWDQVDAPMQSPPLSHLTSTQQRGRSVRGAKVGGAFGCPAHDPDLCACPGGGAQEGSGDAGQD